MLKDDAQLKLDLLEEEQGDAEIKQDSTEKRFEMEEVIENDSTKN